MVHAASKGVRVAVEREYSERDYSVRVELDAVTTHRISENALEDARDPAAVMEAAIRDAAKQHRAFVLAGLLDRLDQGELAALLAERISDPIVAECAMLALAARMESIR